jgi:soluble lytic murein transglycosylase-like protein
VTTLLRLLFCSACLLSPFLSPDARAQTLRYDLAFKRWGEFYVPWQDWRWWKAQGMAESNLNQAARSPAGAIGIMQLMPSTARELGVDPHDAESNIHGGIKYDAALLKQWRAVANLTERRDLAFASYNAGPGNVARAAKLAGVESWTAAARSLPSVTGKHSLETINYVTRIKRFFSQFR